MEVRVSPELQKLIERLAIQTGMSLEERRRLLADAVARMRNMTGGYVRR